MIPLVVSHFAAMNVYTELRNQARRDAWGIGVKKDAAMYIGYGMLGTFTKKTDFMNVSPSKAVAFAGTVVFHKRPSYFKPGKRLKLGGFTATSNLPPKPHYGTKFKAKTKSAMGVPEPPLTAVKSLGSNGNAEPLVAFHSNDNVSIRVASLSAGSLKESFIEYRSQKKAAWRIAMHSDGALYLSYHTVGSTSAGTTAIKMDQKGAVYFYGDTSFGGKTLKKF
jgi:hypothetical protein